MFDAITFHKNNTNISLRHTPTSIQNSPYWTTSAPESTNDSTYITNLCSYTYHVVYVDEHSRPTSWLLNASKWDAQFKESNTVTASRIVIAVCINAAIVTIYKLQSARYITHYKKQTELCFHTRTALTVIKSPYCTTSAPAGAVSNVGNELRGIHVATD